MAYAWTCPDCGDVVPGRKKPGRRNLEVRMCVECLFATEQIVMRVRGAQLSRVVAAKMLRPEPGVWRGIDLQAECDRLCDLEISPAHLRVGRPLVTIKAPHKRCRRAGLALMEAREIILYLRPTTPRSMALATLVHEVAHIWVGVEEEAHGDHWRMTMIELVREGYAEEPEFPENQSYNALDVSCEKALARALQRKKTTHVTST